MVKRDRQLSVYMHIYKCINKRNKESKRESSKPQLWH